RRRLRQRKAAEFLRVRGTEVEPRGFDQIEEFYTGGHPLGPGERTGDRRAHVRRAELREERAIEVLDERVDDALRVHDDIDTVRRQREEKAGLDELQALVHQGRRIDRDLA